MMSSNMLGLRTVIYRVKDLAAATKWYANVFQVQPYYEEVYYVGFNVGGYELGLQPEEGTPKEKSANVLTYWGVDNILDEFQRMIQLGATAFEPPTNVGGEIMVATLKDPWDNVIGLIYNPTFQLPSDAK